MPNIRPFKALRLPPGFSEFTGERNPDSRNYIRDEEDSFYIYRMIRGDHRETGIVSCIDVKDYNDGNVKCHEHVRPEKVEVQVRQIKKRGGNIEPILLTFDSHNDRIPYLEEYTSVHEPTYDFLDQDQVRHQLWKLSDPDTIKGIESFFSNVDAFYICDGHHRIAASSLYSKEFSSTESDGALDESRFFMASIFPSKEMLILDYNRTVTDLNGLTTEEFLKRIEAASFTITERSQDILKPRHGEYTMVLDGIWYRIRYLGQREADNPVSSLDVSILQDKILDDILGITDPRHDKRLGFIRGTRGLAALKEATEKDMKLAFAIAPVCMQEILDVANANMTMPPKSTCFEPKPVSGLIIHEV